MERLYGIEEIASYIPDKRISNYDKKEKFGVNDHFIEKKIGIRKTSVKNPDEHASDLCVKAFNNLIIKKKINKDEIEALVVVTQNPDRNIPHTSAIVHAKLDMPESCACFDISLGCSGFVYGLSIFQSFMKENGLKKGLLFTSDPYSQIIDQDDRNTSMLFGDAASVSIISDSPVYCPGVFTFGTLGREYDKLYAENGKLFMDGGAVFAFSAKYIPNDIKVLLNKNSVTIDEISKFVIHQGSKHIVDTIAKTLKLDARKVVFDIYEYGNTVSSSIPILLEKEIKDRENKRILISGFGVGLSWAGCVLTRL